MASFDVYPGVGNGLPIFFQLALDHNGNFLRRTADAGESELRITIFDLLGGQCPRGFLVHGAYRAMRCPAQRERDVKF